MKCFRLLLLVLLLASPLSSSLDCAAQKAYKPVRNALKAKNYKEALNQIKKLREDSVHRHDLPLCLFSIEANRGLNDAENTKLYLKTPYDTVAFFSTTLEIIREAILLDSLDRDSLANQEQKFRYTKKVCDVLNYYVPNLNAGGRFHYRKGNFKEALQFLRLCLDLPQMPIGLKGGLDKSVLAQQARQNSQLYLTAAFALKNYPEVHRYEDLALEDTTSRLTILEDLVLTAEAEQDTLIYRTLLADGMAEYPSHTIFFTRLADYHQKRGNHGKVLQIATEHLKSNPGDVFALTARCQSFFFTLALDSCIAAAKTLIDADSTVVDAYYYLGASYAGKAMLLKLPENVNSSAYRKAIKQRNEFFSEARPWLETYRTLAPEQKKRWAPLLYKVYWALNLGKQFAEIEKELSTLNH
ncbi:MAG: hypothetical protein ACI3YC_06715 [Alloprevotella sp.]